MSKSPGHSRSMWGFHPNLAALPPKQRLVLVENGHAVAYQASNIPRERWIQYAGQSESCLLRTGFPTGRKGWQGWPTDPGPTGPLRKLSSGSSKTSRRLRSYVNHDERCNELSCCVNLRNYR